MYVECSVTEARYSDRMEASTFCVASERWVIVEAPNACYNASQTLSFSCDTTVHQFGIPCGPPVAQEVPSSQVLRVSRFNC